MRRQLNTDNSTFDITMNLHIVDNAMNQITNYIKISFITIFKRGKCYNTKKTSAVPYKIIILDIFL